MSGIIDMWTSEVARLKENGQSIWSGRYPPSAAENVDESRKTEEGGKWATTTAGVTGFVQRLSAGVKLPPAFQCSEASLSMLLDNLSA
ncbi:unnamed protein product [Linum trigynum]|uniref:Uncharacterized protein n=1 Tax=Linum trigynum TaxID=586398 RepID=A0AAV2DF20_9ROSI